MDRAEIVHVLAGCELFKGLDTSEVEKIAGLCRVETYEAGEEVFRQGDFGEHLYIITYGYVFLERSMYMGKRKGKVNIGILGKGRAFGCWSTILGEPHTIMSSAACHKSTEVLIIKGEDLRQLMLSSTEFGFKVLERLCFLLRDRIQGAYGAMENI